MKTKSITIHGIENSLNQKIQKKSKEFGMSQNRTLKKLLDDSLNNGKNKRVEEFNDLFGTWSEVDEKNFEKAIDDLEAINAEDWK